jgi:hypothetical protein
MRSLNATKTQLEINSWQMSFEDATEVWPLTWPYVTHADRAQTHDRLADRVDTPQRHVTPQANFTRTQFPSCATPGPHRHYQYLQPLHGVKMQLHIFRTVDKRRTKE